MSSIMQNTTQVSTSNAVAPFPFSVRLGIVFIAEASFLSVIAVTGLLLKILYSAVAWRFGFKTSRRWSMETHLHYYFLSMLLADLIQAIGGVLDVKWIADAAVVDGVLCTTQGIFKQIGDVGVALSSLAITIYTFAVLVLHWRPSNSNKPAMLVVAAIWVFIALIIGINAAKNGSKGYWGDTQYWCWISAGFPVQRIVLEYLWLWITAFVDLLLYIPLYLVIKGIFVVEGYKVRYIKKADRKKMASSHNPHIRNANDVALQMLFYPAIYITTVLPVGVVRFQEFHSQNVPFAATTVSDILFSFSGLFNVILFSVTRPTLMPYRDARNDFFPDKSFDSNPTTSSRTYELSALQHAPRINVSVTRSTWPEGSVHSLSEEKKEEDLTGFAGEAC